MKLSEISDEQLVGFIQQSNDNKYFEEIYSRYYLKVYSKCFMMTRSKTVSRDLVQDIFLKTIEKINEFKNKSRFTTWIYAITYNHCIDYLRVNKRLRFNDWSENIEIPEEVSDDEIENVFELKQERLELLFELLKPEDKAILIMKYKDQMSVKSIQIILNGTSEDQVKMKINRAKKRILGLYNQFYPALEE